MAGITKTYDHALLLHDGAVVNASVAGNVAGVARILDIGLGKVYGDIVVDVSAMDVADNDEIITIGVQISDSATFESVFWEVASLAIGDEGVINGDQAMTTGRYIIPFNNMIADGTTKRYLRLYFTEAGTVTTFDCVAYLTMRS
jgi:hypothetical protein